MKNKIEVLLNEDLGTTISLEYGQIAKQADAACIAKLGETVVLATVVFSKKDKETFMVPLTVDYRERTYAAGRIPGGFFRREGRPAEKEILTSRLIDRSIRPLFSENWRRDTFINILVLSYDGANDPDVLAIVAAGGALRMSSIPLSDTVAGVRVGKIDGKLVFNPTMQQQEKSSMDIVVSGTSEGVVMVEAGAQEVSEEEILEAMDYARKGISNIISTFEALPYREKIHPTAGDALKIESVKKKIEELLSESELKKIITTREKKEREDLWDNKKDEVIKAVSAQIEESEKITDNFLEDIFYTEIRKMLLEEGVRADGRRMDEVRHIECYPHYFERTHGSALFQRGQTQVLATVTLGTPDDKQIMDVLEGEYKERVLFHYNFPAFATGEAKPERGVSRREQGHGALAKRALYPVIPSENEFPYTIRIVSDTLESNGSSSMASVCGGSLALFDAGVPVKSAVAGVAMGLVKSGGKYVILTDIMGMEDHIGDMDFKVAGTRSGITALQMDLKITNIDLNIMKDALYQAKVARYFILDTMAQALNSPRAAISRYAPQMEIVQINPSKIGALIGPGGKNIKKITEETKANISVEDDGKVYISSDNPEAMELARQMVDYYTAAAEIGKVYRGKVTRILAIGAFVEILPGKEGLVHISKFSDKRIEKVTDIVKEGDELNVKVTEIDDRGRINLTCKNLDNKFSQN